MKVLITGTSSGIGKGIADKFLREGHHVTGIDCNKSAIQHTAYRHICMDIRDKMHYPELGPFDIVINNAGVQNNNDIDVNLKGTIDITEKYGIHPGIRAVLMIGSASGHNGSEFPEYVASKGGVLSYTKNIALRIAKYGATCNSLDFGGVLTELNKPVMEDKVLWNEIMEQTPLKRWMTVEEAADWAYFMTVTNRFCTGHAHERQAHPERLPLRLHPPQPDHPQPAGGAGGKEPALWRKAHPHGPAHHTGQAHVLLLRRGPAAGNV